jgi:hypothetical protein
MIGFTLGHYWKYHQGSQPANPPASQPVINPSQPNGPVFGPAQVGHFFHTDIAQEMAGIFRVGGWSG